MINIKTDSRKIKKGDIFVAVKCEVNDGHQYIESAIKNGASKIIAEYGTYDIDYEIVSDTREYLNNYLQTNYNKILEEMTLIGITGTNGKTTTAYLIYQMLNTLNNKCAYIGTIGYYLDSKITSLPNTNPDVCDMYDMIINAYDNGYKTVVIEASSHGLKGGRLEGIMFNYAGFTNLTQDHLDFHKNMENYALAKQLLFKKLKPNGKSIINSDDKYHEYFITDKNIYYGFKGIDYKIKDIKFSSHYTIFSYENDNNTYQIKSPLLGDYNVFNLILAIIITQNMGIDIEDITKAILKISPPPGRMDIIRHNKNIIVIDYAHTPDAIEKIIKTVKLICKGNIYTVFGCTGDRDRLKRPIMTNIVLQNSRVGIITIDDLHHEDPHQIINDMLKDVNHNNYKICLDRKEAIRKGIECLKENDVLLILGKGHEDVIIIKDKKIPFNDRDIVEELLLEKINVR